MCRNEKAKNTNQNIVMDRPYIAPFLTCLPPIDSSESQLSIGANVVSWTCFDFGMFCHSLWVMIIVAHPDAPESSWVSKISEIEFSVQSYVNSYSFLAIQHVIADHQSDRDMPFLESSILYVLFFL